MSPEQRIAEASAYLRGRGIESGFSCALILGTGLGLLADAVEEQIAVSYAEIPHFPEPGVSGHGGRLIAGRVAGKRILVLQGRAHYYERGDAAAMRVPIGTIAALGQPPLLLTNAAGSVRPEWPAGRLVALSDHINLTGTNPLIGDSSDARFVPMAGAYDEGLRAALQRAALAAGVPLAEGVYAWFSGPSFETPAEIRMARLLGADLVGMSTVPEVILARYHGLRLAALSLVTNPAAGIADGAHTHHDTKVAAENAAPDLRRLVLAFLAELPDA
jgi:purine-nucleoside phosphorylase